ncbi:MAG TPA: RNA polymerase sigma factor [Candidatus Paceibacterota bacterium]
MKGPEEMFLDTYNTYSDQIFRFVLFKLSDREKAKDLTQETFMKTWIHISKNGNLENVRAFLYKVARNLVVDEYRRKGRVNIRSLDELVEDGYDPKTEESESLMDKIDGREALKFIKQLPQAYSDILFMRYVEELDISEIASALDKSTNVVSVRINRGIKKLKEIISKKNI